MSLFKESTIRSIARSAEIRVCKSADAILEASLSEIPLSRAFEIFLCHSFIDIELILGIKTILEQMGYSVYVDHQVDPQLNREHVTRETANRLRTRMQKCSALFYVTSMNSPNSKWMPWELGYFDGTKGKAAILPLTIDYPETDSFYGQEYLGIYPYITHNPAKGSTDDRLWVHWSSNQYVVFESWLKGSEPAAH